MRITEKVQLRKKYFEVKDGVLTIRIPFPFTKTKEARYTFVTQEATEQHLPHLETLKANDLVFGVNEDPTLAKVTGEFFLLHKEIL